jgi:hypothetical protein
MRIFPCGLHKNSFGSFMEHSLLGSMGMLQNSLCWTIPYYLYLESIVGRRVKQFSLKEIIQKLLVYVKNL